MPKAHGSRKREYSFEIRDRCEGFYVNDGKTLDEIVQLSGVSISQVERWYKKDEWKTKREQFRNRASRAQEEARALMREEILLQDLVNQKNLLDHYFKEREYDKADSNTLSNYINIVTNISKLLQDIRKRDEGLRNAQKADRPQLFLDFVRDLVLFLKDRDPAALTELEKNFDEFIAFAKEKYAN